MKTFRLTYRQQNRRHLRLVGVDEPWRPRTRADCALVERPCVYVGCKWNLYLDVNPSTGSIKFNQPDLEPNEVACDQSCALDQSDAGDSTLEEIGDMLSITKEAVRLVEERALGKMLKASRRLRTA